MTDPDANQLTSRSSKTRTARTQSIARSVRLTLAAACAAAVALGSPARHVSAQTKAAPKLIVILVVDQMRVDYLQWYAANYSGGLARLIREGAWFTEAAYPYLNTITCAGHSTIGTGSFPYRHGMILNNWFDPKTGKSPYCTDDPTVTEISYNNLSPIQGDSGKLMLVPAIGEQVMDRGGRSVALSLKPRSAVTLTGHKATAVVWFDDRGGWTTSSAFTKEPVPFLKSFIDANPLKADAERVWERTLPLSAYQGQDEMTGEGKVTGWSGSFPHPLAVAGGKPEDFYARWQRSPYADEYLERMAEASIDALKLGQGTTVDFLGVSFSAVDGIGHVYGPRSHEIQDALVRLDRTIGKLLDYLDSRVGRGNYILGLSADHGVAEIPEQVGGGRVASKAVAAALEARARASARERSPRPLVGLHEYLSRRGGAHAARERQSAYAKRRWPRCDRCRESSSHSGALISQPSRRAPRRTACCGRPRSATISGGAATSSSLRKKSGSCRRRSPHTGRSTRTTSACRCSSSGPQCARDATPSPPHQPT